MILKIDSPLECHLDDLTLQDLENLASDAVLENGGEPQAGRVEDQYTLGYLRALNDVVKKGGYDR